MGHGQEISLFQHTHEVFHRQIERFGGFKFRSVFGPDAQCVGRHHQQAAELGVVKRHAEAFQLAACFFEKSLRSLGALVLLEYIIVDYPL